MRRSSPTLASQHPFFVFNTPFHKPQNISHHLPLVHPSSNYSQYFHPNSPLPFPSVFSKLPPESLVKMIQQQHQQQNLQQFQHQRDHFNQLQKEVLFRKQNFKLFSSSQAAFFNGGYLNHYSQHFNHVNNERGSFEHGMKSPKSPHQPSLTTTTPNSLQDIENITKRIESPFLTRTPAKPIIKTSTPSHTNTQEHKKKDNHRKNRPDGNFFKLFGNNKNNNKNSKNNNNNNNNNINSNNNNNRNNNNDSNSNNNSKNNKTNNPTSITLPNKHISKQNNKFSIEYLIS